MRWEDDRESDNVEDDRGQSFGGGFGGFGGAGGGVGSCTAAIFSSMMLTTSAVSDSGV